MGAVITREGVIKYLVDYFLSSKDTGFGTRKKNSPSLLTLSSCYTAKIWKRILLRTNDMRTTTNEHQ